MRLLIVQPTLDVDIPFVRLPTSAVKDAHVLKKDLTLRVSALDGILLRCQRWMEMDDIVGGLQICLVVEAVDFGRLVSLGRQYIDPARSHG